LIEYPLLLRAHFVRGSARRGLGGFYPALRSEDVAVQAHQFLAGAKHHGDENAIASQRFVIGCQGSGVAPVLEPSSRTFLTDRGRKRLVKVFIAAGKDALVSQLMEDGLGKVRVGAMDESAENRVLEPSQG
jgi:hypothetical protein